MYMNRNDALRGLGILFSQIQWPLEAVLEVTAPDKTIFVFARSRIWLDCSICLASNIFFVKMTAGNFRGFSYVFSRTKARDGSGLPSDSCTKERAEMFGLRFFTVQTTTSGLSFRAQIWRVFTSSSFFQAAESRGGWPPAQRAFGLGLKWGLLCQEYLN